MELTLCGLAVVLFALWVELELAVKAIGKIMSNSRFSSKDDAADKKAGQHDRMTSLPICLASLPRYHKIA